MTIDLAKAALGNGLVTTSALDSYVTDRVEQFNDQQTAVMERPKNPVFADELDESRTD